MLGAEIHGSRKVFYLLSQQHRCCSRSNRVCLNPSKELKVQPPPILIFKTYQGSCSNRIKDGIPCAELLVLPGSGHSKKGSSSSPLSLRHQRLLGLESRWKHRLPFSARPPNEVKATDPCRASERVCDELVI